MDGRTAGTNFGKGMLEMSVGASSGKCWDPIPDFVIRIRMQSCKSFKVVVA